MSSDSDKFVFQQALEEQDNTSLFQAKRWTYVTDSSSANGQFSGQLQFDLNTLSSQNQWTDLSQGYIQFPVKVSISSVETITSEIATTALNAACIKNGFHNFIDSIQLVVNSCTLQTSQIYTNVDTSFKILTEWSPQELKKWGSSLGLALDDFNLIVDGDATVGTATTAVPTSLDNLAIANLSPAVAGVSIQARANEGFKQRCIDLNSNVSATYSASAIVTNLNKQARGRVQATKATTDTWVAFYLATVRLKDIADSMAKMPPLKNLKGYVYVNYNAATASYTSTGTSGVVKTGMTTTAQYGRCQPVMVDPTCVFAAADSVITVKSEISGIASTVQTSAVPTMTNARLVVPYYVPSPEVDRALTQKKTIRYNERFVTTVPIGKLASTQTTITPGISNPKRLIMLPILTGDDASGAVAGFRSQPELSPFDIAGCGGSSPFASLQQLQVMVGNQPVFQQPLDMDHDTFMNEVAQIGRDGGLDNETGSGLLSQTMWTQLYKYYTVDIGRRINGDDGASKSIQLQCYNPCNAPMRLICIVWYEREITVDTAMGVIVQGV